MNREERERDRINHPDKYQKKIQISYRQVGPDRWEESHDGCPVGIVSEPAYFARPRREVDPEEVEQRKWDEAAAAFDKRTKDPDFAGYQERLRERANRLAEEGRYEEADLLDSDHSSFAEAYDREKLKDLEKRHQERLSAIQERQYQRGNVGDRQQADIDAIEAIEAYQAEQDKIRSARYGTEE